MESSTHTLVDGEKPDQLQAPGFLDPRKSDLEQGSTRAPSTAPDVDSEKRGIGGNAIDDDEKGDSKVEVPNPDEVKLEEYPTGPRLFSIVVALVLSIFLVALDMVRLPT